MLMSAIFAQILQKCYKIVSEMELLTRQKLFLYLFLFVKLHMDPLVIEDINFFIFHWAKLSL